MITRKINLKDSKGNSLIKAFVQTSEYQDTSNLRGEVLVKVKDVNDLVSITTVQGNRYQKPFYTLLNTPQVQRTSSQTSQNIKSIVVQNAWGETLADAHIYIDGQLKGLTHQDGKFTFLADLVDQIRITHVSGKDVSYTINDLPDIVIIEENNLDPVVIGTKKKPKYLNWALLAAGGIASAIIFKNNPKKVQL